MPIFFFGWRRWYKRTPGRLFAGVRVLGALTGRTQDLGSPIAQVTVQSMAGTATELSISELCRVREIKQQAQDRTGMTFPRPTWETSEMHGLAPGTYFECVPSSFHSQTCTGATEKGVGTVDPWSMSSRIG